MAKKKDEQAITPVPAPTPLKTPIPNNVKQYRKDLGFSKVELAKFSHLSEKTISRIEREEEAFAPTTYYKVRNGLNKARKTDGKVDLTIKDLFPTLEEDE